MPSRMLLPLHTSVDLFSDARQPSAVTRAKQAAVLHDTLLVELGFLDVSITEVGSTSWWTPPDQITPEQVARARQPPEQGTPMSLHFGAQPARGVPATDMVTAFSGPITKAYAAEWHSEVLAPLAELGADFIETLATGGGDIPISAPVGKAIWQQNFRDFTDKELMPDVESFERTFIYKSFNRDAAVAQHLGATLQASTLFEPMLRRHGRPATGTTALEVVVPNLERLTWEQVIEFRGHPGADEARGMLREFEELAATQEPGDATDFLLKVSQRVTDGLLSALSERGTSVPKEIAAEGAKTAISFIPVIGPFVEKGISAAQLAAGKVRESRSGVAALMRLRDP